MSDLKHKGILINGTHLTKLTRIPLQIIGRCSYSDFNAELTTTAIPEYELENAVFYIFEHFVISRLTIFVMTILSHTRDTIGRRVVTFSKQLRYTQKNDNKCELFGILGSIWK